MVTEIRRRLLPLRHREREIRARVRAGVEALRTQVIAVNFGAPVVLAALLAGIVEVAPETPARPRHGCMIRRARSPLASSSVGRSSGGRTGYRSRSRYTRPRSCASSIRSTTALVIGSIGSPFSHTRPTRWEIVGFSSSSSRDLAIPPMLSMK